MDPRTQAIWISNAILYGLACTCRSDGPRCARHDERLAELIAQNRNNKMVKKLLGEVSS